jgi:hypothetical protein
MRRHCYLLILCSLVFMGSLWQLEIADLCLTNGWPFGYLFCLIQFPLAQVWAVRDFWMMLLAGSFLIVAAEAIYFSEKRCKCD